MGSERLFWIELTLTYPDESHTKPFVDFDGLFDIGGVRFSCSINSEDPEGVLLSVLQTCHHIVEVGALFWSLIGLKPLHGTRLLILNKIAKDPAFSIMTRQLPLQADRVLGLIIGLRGHWRTGTHWGLNGRQECEPW